MKLQTICPLLHTLFCVLKMSADSDPVNAAPLSASGESNNDIFIFLHFRMLVWNSLPEAIESSSSLESFTSKQWLHSYSYLILYHFISLYIILRLVWCLRDFYWPYVCRCKCRCRYRCTATCSSTTVTAELEVSVSRGSTIRLNMRMVITYPVPQDNYVDPGQGQQDSSYILTPCIFLPVHIKVKLWSNKSCKAMHQPWPFDKGNVLVTAWLFC